MIRIILLTSITLIYAIKKDVSLPRTVDQCYGQPIPVACDPGHMVKVNNAFYRQTESCRGGYRSNYCSKEEPSNPACVGNQTCVFTTPWIYLSSECGYSNNFLVSYQCVPSTIQHNICRKKEIHSTSGYIVSPNYPNKYPKSLQCHTKVKVRPGQRIKVYLLDLYLAYYNYDVDKQCVDALWIVDGKERTDYLCSGRQRGLIFTSRSNEITVFFTSEGHEYLNAKGFWIFFEGVAANTIPPRRVTYVKKPSSRSHATKAEEKLLSVLPIQVTPTDSSIVPPAPANSKEVGVTQRPQAIAKVTAPFKFNGQFNHHQASGRQRGPNNQRSGGATIPQGHRNTEMSQAGRSGSIPSQYRQGQIASLSNTKFGIQQQRNIHQQRYHPPSTQPQIAHYTRKPFKSNSAELISHSKEYRPPRQYSSREYPNRHRPLKDKSKETIREESRDTNARTYRPTTGPPVRRVTSTRRPYIPTDPVSLDANLKNLQTPQSKTDNDIMQINMYNAMDEEEEELFNLLARSGELVKGLKTNNDDIPGVEEETEKAFTNVKEVTKQAPIITKMPLEPVQEDEGQVDRRQLESTTMTTSKTPQEETPAPTLPPETPVVIPNKTAETILPWNSAYASEIKGIQEKEETATGGIVGGAAGCILLVLAFVVLAIFWRRRHPHEKGGFPFSRKSSSYNDIIMAYAPSEAGSTIGAANFGFDECPPPANLKEFPLDSCVANPNYVSPMQSWRNLLPIDEVPEIIYAQHKGGRPGLQTSSKQNRSMLWMRSKSLDDLCAKIGSKVTRRRKKPPEPPIQQSQSLDCLKRTYENVILPASYHAMMTAEERPPPVMQRRASLSLSDLQPIDVFPPPPPLSPIEYDMHLQAMQQHMHQQQLQQQQYLQQQQAVFQHQQQQQSHMQQTFIPGQIPEPTAPNPTVPVSAAVATVAPSVSVQSVAPASNPRPGYETLCLDGAAVASPPPVPAHTAALEGQEKTLLSRYETMALQKTPAADEVAL